MAGLCTLRTSIGALQHAKACSGDAGTQLVLRAIQEIVAGGADEVVLEAEVTNRGALALYEGLGFLRDKRLLRCAAPHARAR